ncbi:hypothetical protein MLD38_021940 [Melastoma candidum]|uniref:Uncharacterized protein n=1 Tax=Melastoma candidum TaxID=119954 RepID=A0ACB9QHK3_9MYRT|nr:hypothetical protein MLD38_021940 [Melastoma candidum]
MASACVNNSLPLSPLPSPPPDLTPSSSSPDFEFCHHDQPPVPMLPADQLFSQGFLLPLPLPLPLPSNPPPPSDLIITSPLFSPKSPPRCSSRWRDLLRLDKLPSPSQTTASAASRSFKHFLRRSSKSAIATLSSSSDSFPLLNHSDSLDFSIPTSSRLSLSSSSSSSQAHDHDDLPRLSLDSDKTRPSRIRSLRPRSDGLLPYLDNNSNCTINGRGRNGSHPVAVGNTMGRSPIRKSTAAVPGTAAPGAGAQPDAANRGVSVDSPRMNSSGRVVFQSLERSSSSPSSFNNGGGGGQRMKHRGVERSYSAGVRITPVLNVPICTLRSSTGGGSKSGGSSGVFGLGQLFISSPQKKENGNGVSNAGRGQRRNNGKSSSRG